MTPVPQTTDGLKRITSNMISELRPGDVIRFSNGYEYDEKVLSEWSLKCKFIGTGLQNEVAWLTDCWLVKKDKSWLF